MASMFIVVSVNLAIQDVIAILKLMNVKEGTATMELAKIYSTILSAIAIQDLPESLVRLTLMNVKRLRVNMECVKTLSTRIIVTAIPDLLEVTALLM